MKSDDLGRRAISKLCGAPLDDEAGKAGGRERPRTVGRRAHRRWVGSAEEKDAKRTPALGVRGIGKLCGLSLTEAEALAARASKAAEGEESGEDRPPDSILLRLLGAHQGDRAGPGLNDTGRATLESVLHGCPLKRELAEREIIELNEGHLPQSVAALRPSALERTLWAGSR